MQIALNNRVNSERETRAVGASTYFIIQRASATTSFVSRQVTDICYKLNIQPYSQMVAILICNLGHWQLCYLPLVGIGKFDSSWNCTGHTISEKNKEVMFDDSWTRKGYKK